MADFFKPEDFDYGFLKKFDMANVTPREAAYTANMKIIQNFEPNNYKPQENEINLYVLVDSGGYICYTSSQEDLVKNYKESNCFTNKTIVKLTGFLPAGEK